MGFVIIVNFLILYSASSQQWVSQDDLMASNPAYFYSVIKKQKYFSGLKERGSKIKGHFQYKVKPFYTKASISLYILKYSHNRCFCMLHFWWDNEKKNKYFVFNFRYIGFHKKGTFSVHSFNDDYLSIPEPR